MLVLSRKVNESVMIGDLVEVVVLQSWGSKVRLGFKCPQEVPVHRKEIYDRIKAGVEPPSKEAIEDADG